MFRVLGCITQRHDPGLLIVAVVICAVGCWTTVALLSRARHNDARAKALWVIASSTVFSLAVWATHFISMLAFRSSLPLSYDVGRTTLSILAAVFFTWCGFTIAVRSRAYAGAGLVVGAGISAMHYIGMSAIGGPFRVQWDGAYVMASVLSGAILAGLAFHAREQLPARFARAAKATLLTLSVCGVHFLGMTALTIVPNETAPVVGSKLPSEAIAIAVGAVALLIVALGLISAYLDLYLEIHRSHERRRLKAHIANLEATKLELGLALETAYAANKSKSAFLAAMSHELRTPLNAIIGFSELMTTEPFGPLGHSRYKGYSSDIGKAGTHLLDIINDILDISRLEARKAELIEAEIALPDLFHETVSQIETLADEAGLTLRSHCPPEIPLLWGDCRRVKQILLNLLSNAIKFTPGGGTVTLEACVQDGAIELRVRDTGIGISKADLPKAFESFGQIDSRLSRKYEGSGLGLPLARHLTELHGGSLVLESEANVGTTAIVCFPKARSVAIVAARVA
jgi:signal transduction histidine kinase